MSKKVSPGFNTLLGPTKMEHDANFDAHQFAQQNAQHAPPPVGFEMQNISAHPG